MVQQHASPAALDEGFDKKRTATAAAEVRDEAHGVHLEGDGGAAAGDEGNTRTVWSRLDEVLAEGSEATLFCVEGGACGGRQVLPVEVFNGVLADHAEQSFMRARVFLIGVVSCCSAIFFSRCCTHKTHGSDAVMQRAKDEEMLMMVLM